ncbi:MAG TPA: calcium-binding protein, partial [Steroidobacteraceae bacterium]|nr:calcium-binding protein [Steroidobacteraceae bacterium]
AGDDVFGIAGDAGGVGVFGLQAEVNVSFAEAGDRVVLNGQGGDDVIDATGLAAGGPALTINGGLGDDVMFGGAGADLMNGGDGDDVALMGAGDDTFVWNPGDDNDTIEGQAGFDTMLFNGAGASENVNIFANGGRAVFFRDVASVTMDMNDVEQVVFNALGGVDNIVVEDLSGTDLTEIDINLGSAIGGTDGDGAADTVTAQGTSADDVALVIGNASGVSVVGLAAQINITGAESGNDRLIINGFAGDDVIEASSVSDGAIQLTLDGGAGDDILVGGEGNDTLLGGAGDDVLIGGPGADTLDGGDGDDVIVSDGFDIVVESFAAGANSEDRIDLSGRGLSFDWLMAHATESDGNTVLDLGDHQLTLNGVRSSQLHEHDFILG